MIQFEFLGAWCRKLARANLESLDIQNPNLWIRWGRDLIGLGLLGLRVCMPTIAKILRGNIDRLSVFDLESLELQAEREMPALHRHSGIDLVSIERITKVYYRHTDRFLKRAFHPQEIAAFQLKFQASVPQAFQYLSSRWAVKEALIKACRVVYVSR